MVRNAFLLSNAWDPIKGDYYDNWIYLYIQCILIYGISFSFSPDMDRMLEPRRVLLAGKIKEWFCYYGCRTSTIKLINYGNW